MEQMEKNEFGYPDFNSEAMQELNNWTKQLIALLGPSTGIFNPYVGPSAPVADVGIALKQSALLSKDIAYMCNELHEQYQEARAKQRDKEALARLSEM